LLPPKNDFTINYKKIDIRKSESLTDKKAIPCPRDRGSLRSQWQHQLREEPIEEIYELSY